MLFGLGARVGESACLLSALGLEKFATDSAIGSETAMVRLASGASVADLKLHHPRARGYETWLGYWHHSNDYWSHAEEKCGIGKSVHDLWVYNATFDGPATHLANGPSCSQDNQAPPGERCVFEEHVLRDEVVRLIETHNASTPLFLLYSMHLVHVPLPSFNLFIAGMMWRELLQTARQWARWPGCRTSGPSPSSMASWLRLKLRPTALWS